MSTHAGLAHSLIGQEPQRSRGTMLTIAAVASIAITIICMIGKVHTYRFGPVFLVPLVWIGYFVRRPMRLSPGHYALFCIAILLHTAGAFGFYQSWPIPISFDIIVHTYFGFVAGLILHRFASAHVSLHPVALALCVILFVMGIGALHEIMEYISTLILGPERGMLKPGTSYIFDTQRDLLSNLVGVTIAALISALRPSRPAHI